MSSPLHPGSEAHPKSRSFQPGPKPPSLTKARASLIIVIVVVVLVLAALGAGSYSNAAALAEETDWVVHGNQVLDELQDAFEVVQAAEDGERGYLLSGNSQEFDLYRQAVQTWPSVLAKVRSATRHSQGETSELEPLVDAIETRFQQMADTISVYQAGRQEQALAMIRNHLAHPLMVAVRTMVNSLRAQESGMIAQRLANQRSKALESSREILLLSVLVVGTGVVGLWLLRRAEGRESRTAGQLRGIIEGSSDAIVAVDKTLRILVFNEAFSRYHQTYNHTTPQVGEPVLSLIHTLPEDRRIEVAHLYSRAVRGEEITTILERPYEGEVQFFDWRFSPIRNEWGKLIGTAHLMRNVTQERRAELQFADYARKLEASNRELTDFAFIASHDLQEPLRKILAFGDRLQVLQADRFTPEGLDHLQRMQSAANRMQQLIRDLLDYSRVTTKGRPPEPVDLNKVLAEAMSDLQIRIQETGARIAVTPFAPAVGDPTQLRQLFENLLGNALKYHRPGVPPVITVTTEPTPTGPPVILVRDNGIGFDPRHTEKIFEVFQRLHGRGDFEGTGIGLAICRKIVTRHGGTITAEGRPGEGATFLIQFPEQFWAATRRTA